MTHSLKTGVFVDVANIILNGGYGMRYDLLRKFAEAQNATLLRLNAYVSYDRKRGEDDMDYRNGQLRFHSILRDIGYKVITKEVRWYSDSEGNLTSKSNVDMDLAVDALLQARDLDRVILVTGDGDFVQVVRALQNQCSRVEAIAFSNASGVLRREVDAFFSGYLIPNLLPIRAQESAAEWGELNSYVRGTCLSYDMEKHYGFFRYYNDINGDLWRTDHRDPLTPYHTIFFHSTDFAEGVEAHKLTHRQHVLEFEIAPGPKEGQTKAVNIRGIPAVY